MAKKRHLGITSKTALFCCGSERTLHGEAAAEEIGVRPIPVWQRTVILIETVQGVHNATQGVRNFYRMHTLEEDIIILFSSTYYY